MTRPGKEFQIPAFPFPDREQRIERSVERQRARHEAPELPSGEGMPWRLRELELENGGQLEGGQTSRVTKSRKTS